MLHLDQHGIGHSAGDVGLNLHLGGEGRQRAGRLRPHHGDLNRRRPGQIGKRHRRTRQKAGQVQRRNAGQARQQHGQSRQPDRPAPHGLPGQNPAQVEPAQLLRHLLLQALTELQGIPAALAPRQFHRGQQPLAQGRRRAFQKQRGFRLVAPAAEMPPSRAPGSGRRAGVAGEREPGSQDLRHPAQAVQQGDHQPGRQGHRQQAEHGTHAQKQAAAGPERMQRAESDRTKLGIHAGGFGLITSPPAAFFEHSRKQRPPAPAALGGGSRDARPVTPPISPANAWADRCAPDPDRPAGAAAQPVAGRSAAPRSR